MNDDKTENMLKALDRKKQFELEHALNNKDHFQFLGGYLKYHQWIALTFGTVFVSLALLHQKGSFLYFYIFGLYKISKDTVKTHLDMGKTKLSPLIYYIFSGLIILIVLTEAGYPIPDMSLGLIQNINEVAS